MRMFKTEKEQIQEDENKRYIKIPIPQRFYCMEHKIYETPQEFNEELNRRTQASDFRNNVAYEKGREEAIREVVKKIIDAGKLDFCDALLLEPNKKPSRQRIGRFYADVAKLNEALSEYGVEIKETARENDVERELNG